MGVLAQETIICCSGRVSLLYTEVEDGLADGGEDDGVRVSKGTMLICRFEAW
jgi:hypothetical protein